MVSMATDDALKPGTELGGPVTVVGEYSDSDVTARDDAAVAGDGGATGGGSASPRRERIGSDTAGAGVALSVSDVTASTSDSLSSPSCSASTRVLPPSPVKQKGTLRKQFSEATPSSGSFQPVSLNVPLIEIEEFVETTIVIKRDKKNELGISVVGGCDTYLETVCVSDVHKDGAVYRDGRLKAGDIILAVNDRSLRELTSAEAIRLLREAPSPVRLVVLRENPQLMFTTPEDPTKYVTVELRKQAVTDRLGLSIMQAERNGNGVFVTFVSPGSIAARQGRVHQGDRFLEVNGQNVSHSNQKELAATILNLDGAIVLLLGRVPSLAHSIQEWARMKVGSPGRIRTSTWSYTAKEKLQTQRPSLPVSAGKDTYELLIPVPIPFPIPPPLPSPGLAKTLKRLGSGRDSERSGIMHNMRRTLGQDAAKLPLVVPLKIDEEFLHAPLREKVSCPKIEVTNY